MLDFLQTIRHRKSIYHRPTSRWICGGECRDCPCYLGPDAKGHCQAGRKFGDRTSGQCLPRKSGDRWLCTRQETHGGEPCEQGPLPDGSCCMSVAPCRPKRSLRSLRGLFAIGVALATVVWLVAILAPDPAKGVDPMAGLSPGPLSANHSFLESQCFRCHSAQDLSAAAIGGMHGRALDDGRLCLTCHHTIGGADSAFAFSAHTAGDLPQDAKGTGKPGSPMMRAATAISNNHLADGGIHCATCHQEHHGERFNIATLSNQQCQVCHRDQFESFSNGHPEFSESKYPYSRRTGIRFDHYSHYQTHFKEDLKTRPESVPAGFDPAAPHAESASCAACHTTGKPGEPMTVKSFETSCAACHDADTRGGEPLAFLAFPTLNKAALNGRLVTMDPPSSLGTWIEEPANSFPWPTLQLLRKDARDAWARLRAAGIDPFDAEAPAPDDAKAVTDIETIAWAVKELARDLSQNQPQDNPSNMMGHDELIRRLGDAGFSDPELLVKGIPAGAFDAMRHGFSKENYMRLLDEVNDMRKGAMPPPVSPEPPAASTAKPAGTTKAQPENFGDDSGESFGEESKETFGDKGGETFGDDNKETTGNNGGGETFGGDEEFGAEPKKDEGAAETKPKELEPIDPTNWATHGGWYQQYGALYYRSTGHADPLIRNWLDQLAKHVDSPLPLAQLKDGFDFRAGAESKASGSCFKCHAVDEIRDRDQHLVGARIHWQSLAGDGGRRTLTRYDHATHLLLTDCRSCHKTRTDGDGFLTSFPKSGDWDDKTDWSAKADPLKFVGNFTAIQRQACAECHQPAKAGDACIQCHLYHKASSRHGAALETTAAPSP